MGNLIIPTVKQLIQKNGKKIYVYFGKRTIGPDYDPYSKNYTYELFNPKTIKGYVTVISPEKLVWKEYGLQEMGAVEILCEAKYKDWFKTCVKVTIDDVDYSVFKVGAGNRVLIQDRPGELIRVVMERKN